MTASVDDETVVMDAIDDGQSADAWRGYGSWSEWRPFEAVTVLAAPVTPGVYVVRAAADGGVVYVGMAGERRGKGLRERLGAYVRGRAPHSGLGSLCMDQALADVDWLRSRADAVEAGARWDVYDWARAAIERARLEVCWVTTESPEAARLLEHRVLASMAHRDLWNRRR